MKNSSKTLLAVLAIAFVSCGLLSQQAQATPMVMIQGEIQFIGTVEFNTTNLDTATQVTTWFDAFGNAGHTTIGFGNTGDFAGITPGTQVNMAQPWIFNPSTPTPNFWSVGGFTFNLLSSTIITQTKSFLNIEGTGIVSGNGFTPTVADFAFSVQNAGGGHHVSFTFSANETEVPDGGSTVAFLGLALTGIEVLRRKLRIG
jgi:hypothetical protein